MAVALNPALLTTVKVMIEVTGLDVFRLQGARPAAVNSCADPHTVTSAVMLPSLTSIARAPLSQGCMLLLPMTTGPHLAYAPLTFNSKVEGPTS